MASKEIDTPDYVTIFIWGCEYTKDEIRYIDGQLVQVIDQLDQKLIAQEAHHIWLTVIAWAAGKIKK